MSFKIGDFIKWKGREVDLPWVYLIHYIIDDEIYSSRFEEYSDDPPAPRELKVYFGRGDTLWYCSEPSAWQLNWRLPIDVVEDKYELL